MKQRDELDFVMSFVAASKRYKDQFVPKWQEVLASFLVQPDYGTEADAQTPYDRRSGLRRKRAYGIRDTIILKDPETHKVVMTYAAKIVKAIFGDNRREFVQARPVGWEDAQTKAPEVTKLLRYAFNVPGHYRTMVEAVVDMLLFGTAVIESPWRYEEREVPIREVTSIDGIETDTETRSRVPVYDDVCLRVIAPEDFFPDPSQYRIHDMAGVAKKFKVNRMQAKAMAASGIYDKAATDRALLPNSSKAPGKDAQDEWRYDKPEFTSAHSDFGEMIGYEYWGDVPWVDDQGVSRRVITVLNGEVVRSRPYPYSDYCLPFHTLIINPVNGRFYGVSPAEVIRYDQSFADALKMLVAMAVVRDVNRPIAIDSSAGDIDTGALKAWDVNTPILVSGGPNAVGTMKYDANFAAAFNVQGLLTQSMQGSSGALGAIQGEEGPDRESATVGAQRYAAAMDRPELAGLVIENECLPPIGRAILKRYQQFLDTDGLKKRIGELPEGMWIGDIMADFDIEFVGSRQSMSRQEKLQAFDRVVAYANTVPAFQLMLPNAQIAATVVADWLEMPELVQNVGTPETILQNLAARALTGDQGGVANGNGAIPGGEPAGMMEAQAGGGVYGAA